MLPSKFDSANGDGDGNSNSGQLLRDIEAISKALYLHKNPQKGLISPPPVRSKSVERPRFIEQESNPNPIFHKENVSYKNKKPSSVWNWKKPFKALTHIRSQKFNVCFFLHVHSIEGLPPSFNDINLSVHWKRKDEVLQTRPSSVVKGVVEFDETLMHKCSVYGSRSGPHHPAKYEEKLFLIFATVIGAPGVDMGKQWVDLTRLLPLTLEELERERSIRKWTTSFKLVGKAKGATLNISFGFSLLRDSLIRPRSDVDVPELLNVASYRSIAGEPRVGFGTTNSNATLRRIGSVPSDLNRRSPQVSQSVVKIYDDVSPNLGLELSESINFLYEKLNEAKLHGSQELEILSEHVQLLKPNPRVEFQSDKDGSGNECDNIDFTVIDKGIEISEREWIEPDQNAGQTVDSLVIETISVDEIIKDEDIDLGMETTLHSEEGFFDTYLDKLLVNDSKDEDHIVCKERSSVEDLESTFCSLLGWESTKLESPRGSSEIVKLENYLETTSNQKAREVLKKSRSLDEVTESVASDFLNMLGIEHVVSGSRSDSDPESPREILLREFEKEALASGSFFVDYGAGEHEEFGYIGPNRSSRDDFSEDFDLSLAIQTAEEEQCNTSHLLSRRKAKILEDLETEDLMKEWGLDEKAFQSSPRYYSDGFGSPIELLPEDPVELPPLGDGFGPFVQTKDGGCLRSMNPSLFKNSKNVGNLIMQVSRPVVLPAEMGSDIMDILQHLALVGLDKLSLQLNELLPFEDVTGKTLQQIALDAADGATVSNRQAPLHYELLHGQDMFNGRNRGRCSGWFFKNMKSSVFVSDMDYVTLEFLAPLILNKIEAISLEGLRVQSGMSEEKPPSSISPHFIEDIIYSEEKSDLHKLLNLDVGSEMQLLDERYGGKYVDRLLGLSITLEEWLKLDAGTVCDEDEFSNIPIITLAAHHAKCIDFANERLTRDGILDKAASCRKKGLLGNNITLALRILLRDPLRNYEAVGASMLALIQLERAVCYPKPMLYGSVLTRSCSEEEDHERISKEETSCTSKEEEAKEGSVWFKITEVHLSGLNTEPGKVPHWCTKAQQQSGTRWLVGSGLSKSYKQPFSKSKAIVVSYPQTMKRVQTGDILWSISSHCNSTETKWNEVAGFAPHVRNPDVIFPK